MKFAFLSDIHANLPALEAALRLTDRLHVDRLVAAGDIVGDGPHPSETVALLRARAAYAIRGNVDREIMELGSDQDVLRDRMGDGATARERNRAWTALRITARQRRWLGTMVGRSVFHVEGLTVMVVHGSPAGDTDPVYPSITEEALRSKLGDGPTPDVLVCGHSHVPFIRWVGNILVVNCGSVGMPVDGDPRGSLAVVDFLEEADPVASIIRFRYDTAAASRRVERAVPGVADRRFEVGARA